MENIHPGETESVVVFENAFVFEFVFEFALEFGFEFTFEFAFVLYIYILVIIHQSDSSG